MKIIALVIAVDGCRIIDFVLSNLVNSKISTICVIAQHEPQSLIRHVHTVWGALGAGGRIRVLLPRSEEAADRFKGTADAVYQNLELIERHRPDVVAVLGADRVYRMDVRQMAAAHCERGAYATLAVVPVPIGIARSFRVVAADENGRIRQFEENPARPAPMPTDPARAYASMGNYVFDPCVLAGLLCRARKDGGSDFGRDILPALVRCPRAFAYDCANGEVSGDEPYAEADYWRDVGTTGAPKAAQDDVSELQLRFELSNLRRPIHCGHNSSPGL
jgi:glucose-1-phosphate adenylyltransferase